MTTTTMPVITDADALLAYLDRHDYTKDDLLTGLVGVGRNDGPYFVHTLYGTHGLDRRWAAEIVPMVWSMVEFPMHALDREEWADLFEEAGYTHNGRRWGRPRKARTLYRGADEAHRDGWSWTDDVKTARWFAERFSDWREPGQVWAAVVEPDRLLARITNVREGESEYVVNTDGLVITGA